MDLFLKNIKVNNFINPTVTEADFTQRVNSNAQGLLWQQSNADERFGSMILDVADPRDDE